MTSGWKFLEGRAKISLFQFHVALDLKRSGPKMIDGRKIPVSEKFS